MSIDADDRLQRRRRHLGDLDGVGGRALPVPDEPTCTPRARSSAASSRRGVRRRVVDRHLAAGVHALNPSFTVSAPSGPTSPSVR